jgi:hypothetical protein
VSAIISADDAYRYRLDRDLVRGLAEGDVVASRRCLFVMLNPSTADAERDDATVRRCRGFAERYDCVRLTIVNLFALRSTDPDELLGADDPVGPENGFHVADAALGAALIIVAWGDHRARLRRFPYRPSVTQEAHVWDLLAVASQQPVWCLGTCRSGAPLHPVRLPYHRAVLRPWEPS